jgi:hypothetical protein
MIAKTKVRRNTASPGQLTDRLGNIKAQIADLKILESELRDALIATGVSEAEGQLFRATISQYDYDQIDWKVVVESLEKTPEVKRAIARNTCEKSKTQVKVVSR